MRPYTLVDVSPSPAGHEPTIFEIFKCGQVISSDEKILQAKYPSTYWEPAFLAFRRVPVYPFRMCN